MQNNFIDIKLVAINGIKNPLLVVSGTFKKNCCDFKIVGNKKDKHISIKMINGSITDFIDQLNFRQEIEFLYKDRKYFIQGWCNDDKTETTLVLTEENDEPFTGYLWEYHAGKMSECADSFLNAEIWDGKCFLQIQNEITWTDW